MNTEKYKGLRTALITPFKEGNGIDNEVDYEALGKILKMQIDGAVDGVLLLGTTGETPCLAEQEQLDIVKFAVLILKGKTKVMVNVGVNSTSKSIENLKRFENIDGIDCYLVVNPYYNKPTQTGLYKHFTSVANSTSKDIFVYNIQGRTAINLETDTLLKVIESSPNVVGVKEASGNLDQMKEVISKTNDDFVVLSGDDAMTYDLINAGGHGIISVASNCTPGDMKVFVDACLSGSSDAGDLNDKYNLFFDKLFIQTNPLPAKTFLANTGIIKEAFRLPICKMDNKERKEFLELVDNYNF